MKSIHEILKKFDACSEAAEWTKGKSWQEIYETCHRGDWLLWLFARTNPEDIKLLTLAKGHCANTVRHLMRDERSIGAVDAAIAFGEGKISIDELNKYAAYAAAAANAADYAAAYAVAYAAYAAAATVADANAYAAYAAAAATAADAYDDVHIAKAKNQQQTADICRKYLPIEIWNVRKE